MPPIKLKLYAHNTTYMKELGALCIQHYTYGRAVSSTHTTKTTGKSSSLYTQNTIYMEELHHTNGVFAGAECYKIFSAYDSSSTNEHKSVF
jgi:hypothetical protein